MSGCDLILATRYLEIMLYTLCNTQAEKWECGNGVEATKFDRKVMALSTYNRVLQTV